MDTRSEFERADAGGATFSADLASARALLSARLEEIERQIARADRAEARADRAEARLETIRRSGVGGAICARWGCW